MTAHWLFGKGTAAFRNEVPLLESYRLLIEAGVPDDGGRNLSVIGLDDSNAIFREVLISYVKGIAINYRLDHRWIQEAQPLSRAGDLISHALWSQSQTAPTDVPA